MLSGGDGRLGVPSPTALSDRKFEDLQAAIGAQLAQGPVSLSLVGDIDEDAAIKAVASTLGALPARSPRQRTGFAEPGLAFKATGTTTLTHSGQADQGVLSVSWPTTDDRDLKDSLTRGLLAQAMSLAALDLVREKLGATYTPRACPMTSPPTPGSATSRWLLQLLRRRWGLSRQRSARSLAICGPGR